MVANHGGSPSGRLIVLGGRASPPRVTGRWEVLPETVRDLALDGFLLPAGAEVLRLFDLVVLVPFAGVFLAGVFWVVLKPRLTGRLPGDGVDVSGSTIMGSLARRPRPHSSSSSSPVVARLRRPIGTGLAVEMGILDELFRRPGLLYRLGVVS